MDPQFALPCHVQVEEFRRKHRTGLVTLLFTDLVGSTQLKTTLGDREGVALIQTHHQLVRDILQSFPEAQEISTAGDSFFLIFLKPSDAVRFALLLQGKLRAVSQGSTHALRDRIGIHFGEVVIEQREDLPKPKDLYGMQVDLCARVMSLAQADQVLLTRFAFDNARQALKGEDIPGLVSLAWLNHGPYLLSGVEEPIEICEVGEIDRACLKAPADVEKARRKVSVDEEPVLGWRPALDQVVPNTMWVLEKKLGEGGFGEVWLGRHQAMKERRVFKFCFRADRVRSLKREMTLFRLIKERIGDHPNIVSLREVYFDQPPFYVEEEYVAGEDLKAWCESRGGAEKVPLETKLGIIAQIADALQAAHDAGVIHRDVKPANILVSESKGQVGAKLTDFGIGQVVSQEYLAGVTKAGFTQTILGPSSSSQTGTQLYMAPELFAGKPASTRSDIYSLGVVLYQLLVNDFTQPVTTDWAKDITDPLFRDDLQHCFAGKPEDRFAGAAQLQKNLCSLQERRVALAARERLERSTSRRRLITLVSAGTAAVLLLLALVLFYGLRQAQAQALIARRNAYTSDMNLAFAALEEGNLGRAAELVRTHQPGKDEPDLRGWEWRYLWRHCQSDELLTLGQHSNAVAGLAFSPDGKTLASGSYDQTVRLWDVASRREIATLVQDEQIKGLSFSPDGRILATISKSWVTLWEVGSRHILTKFPAFSDLISSVAFSPDGKMLAFPGKDGRTELADMITPGQTRPLWELPPAPVACNDLALAFSPDGRTLACGVWGGRISIRDAVTGAEKSLLTNDVPITLVFSPDGRSLVSVGWRHVLRVWDTTTWQEKTNFPAHVAWIGSARFLPNGKILATGSADQKIKLWDTVDWKLVTELKGHLHEIWALAISPDGTTLASGSKDGQIKLWSPVPKNPDNLALSMPELDWWKVCADNRTILTSTSNTVRVIDGKTLTNTMPVFTLPAGYTAVDFSPSSQLLVFGEKGGLLRLHHLPSNREVGLLKGLTNAAVSLVVSPDERALASLGSDGELRLWDVANRRQLASYGRNPFHPFFQPWAFSPDSRIFAVGWADGTIHLWHTSGRGETGVLQGHNMAIIALAFSPNSRNLASIGNDGTAKIWDVATQRQVGAPLRGQLLGLMAIAWSPDGRRLLTGTGEGTVKFWDVTTRKELATLKGPVPLSRMRPWVILVTFLDSDTLLTGDSFGTFLLWRAARFAEIDQRVGPGLIGGSKP